VCGYSGYFRCRSDPHRDHVVDDDRADHLDDVELRPGDAVGAVSCRERAGQLELGARGRVAAALVDDLEAGVAAGADAGARARRLQVAAVADADVGVERGAVVGAGAAQRLRVVRRGGRVPAPRRVREVGVERDRSGRGEADAVQGEARAGPGCGGRDHGRIRDARAEEAPRPDQVAAARLHLEAARGRRGAAPAAPGDAHEDPDQPRPGHRPRKHRASLAQATNCSKRSGSPPVTTVEWPAALRRTNTRCSSHEPQQWGWQIPFGAAGNSFRTSARRRASG